MEITALQLFRGANVYTGESVLAVSVTDSAARGLKTEQLQQLLSQAPFNLRFTEAESWPAPEDGLPPTHPTLVARLALFLQVDSGASLEFHTVEWVNSKQARAIFAFEDEICAQEAGWLAVALINWCTRSPAAETQALADRLTIFMQHAPRRAASLYTRPMLDAARARNIPCSRVATSNYYRLGYGSRQLLLLESGMQANNWIANHITQDKALTHSLLLAQGLPVPRQFTVNSVEDAVHAAQDIGYPVVVKPPNLHQGKGVHLNLKNEAGIRQAFTAAQQYCPAILVEEHVTGKDYRLLVVGGELVAVAQRRPPQVIGDGVGSIEALIAALNKDPRRDDNNQAALAKITVDEEITRTLKDQQLTTTDIPALGRIVPLRRLPSVTLGGDVLDQMELIHPDNRQLAIDAAATSGLAIAGVDLLCPDISKSYLDVGGAICEINAIPGLNAHYNVAGGMTAVAGKLVDMAFPDPASARIPIIVAPAQDALVRQLAGMLDDLGHRAGLWLEGRAIIQGRTIDADEQPQIAHVLQSPLVDVACLAPEPHSMMNNGLGFDHASWAVLLAPNIPPASAALLARHCDKVLLPQSTPLGQDWPAEILAKTTRLPQGEEPARWLAQQALRR